MGSSEFDVLNAGLQRISDDLVSVGNKVDALDRSIRGGNGVTGLVTQVAIHTEQIKGLHRSAERAGGRAGAQWGGLVGTAIAAVAAAFWAIVTGKQQ